MKTKLTILTAFLIIGCGSTKKLKQSQSTQIKSDTQSETVDKSQTTTNESTNVKIESRLDIDNVNQTITETFTAKPIDNTKPAVLIDNGKTINLNNTELTKTKTTDFKRNINKSITKVDSSKKVAENVKNDIKTTNKTKVQVAVKSNSKNVDREQFDFTWVIILITCIGLLLYWWFIGRYKRKNK